MPSERHAIDALVAAIFAAWFVATCLRQLPGSFAARATRWDVTGLLPVWRFFAPMPGPFDFHLVYRDELEDGSLTEWAEHRAPPARRWWAFAWNPDKRLRKALLDVSQELARTNAAARTREQVTISVPYLVLLNFVSALPRLPPAAKTQFALMVSRGAEYDEKPEFLFVSAPHAV